jgi:aspartate kinase
MKVFKFGGASVKDAEAVKNVGEILRLFEGQEVLVVVSAMGKTTNALERLTLAYFRSEEENKNTIYKDIKLFHDGIISGLLKQKDSNAYDDIENLFIELECLLETQPEGSYDFNYDQIVSYGEIFSSRILSTYLKESGISNRWIDSRNFIQTDTNYREAKIDWELTSGLIEKKLRPILQKQTIVTQGFIGQNKDKQTTTLGREGSDYSAAILAYGLGADSVTIWKDVAGVMNADPKRRSDAVKIDELSYDVAIELAYYGATVIHPKTIQPLKSRNIPLFVKSFLDPEAPGTVISSRVQEDINIPYFIVKDRQAMISLSSKDFSFIVEENLRQIFSRLSDHKVRVNLMQNSAISFSLVVNDDELKTEKLVQSLSEDFNISVVHDAHLITVRNYAGHALNLDTGKRVLLEQKTDEVMQLVIEP